MCRTLSAFVIMAFVVAGGCAKPSDGCKAHTGDGLCADPGKNPQGMPIANP